MDKNELKDIVNSIKKTAEIEKLNGCGEVCLKEKKAVIKKGGDYNELTSEMSGCKKCDLSDTRTNVVVGEGSLSADLMFVGEAPGADEDAQGRPFIGRAGKLLTKIIESMGLEREEVFIGNILKCRPPANRNPMPTEIIKCSPYLIRQIEFIKPKVICALGKFAAQTLLDSDVPIIRLRGEFHDYHGVKLMPTYHPAYLLHNSAGKKDVWEDMQMIAKELGIKIPRDKE